LKNIRRKVMLKIRSKKREGIIDWVIKNDMLAF
jgi:hypothetical protein